MFTEDYLMRIINQAIAALLAAIGLRKAGKYLEATQAVEQAIEQVTALPTNVVDEMEDASLLTMLTTNGQLDIGRLAVLADLYQEQGEILFGLDQPKQGLIAFGRALRFILEVALAENAGLPPETMGKVETLTQRLKGCDLPVDTQMVLSDYYRQLLAQDDRTLAAGGMSRKQITQELEKLQDQLDSSMNPMGN